MIIDLICRMSRIGCQGCLVKKMKWLLQGTFHNRRRLWGGCPKIGKICRLWMVPKLDFRTRQLIRFSQTSVNLKSIFSWNFIAQIGTENFWRISALASKMGQIKIITNIIIYTNWGEFNIIKCLHFFLIWPILEDRAEILQKILVTFWAM